uniref:Putative secreted protein n=1 Tax=Ixodes ricinus TaxID=34613 RepID=A0A6B0U0Y4_IXORI
MGLLASLVVEVLPCTVRCSKSPSRSSLAFFFRSVPKSSLVTTYVAHTHTHTHHCPPEAIQDEKVITAP